MKSENLVKITITMDQLLRMIEESKEDIQIPAGRPAFANTSLVDHEVELVWVNPEYPTPF